MQLKRREFLKRSAFGLGGLVAGARFACAAEDKPAFFDPYEQITLGKTGLKVSRLCLGTGMKGGNRESNHTRMGKQKFERLIRGAYDRGIRLFDLADLYGTHPYLIPALNEIPRGNFVILTKIWWRDGNLPERERPDAEVVIGRFLKELKTDYIDLVLLHCVTAGNWPGELARQMEILSRLKEKGVVRALGVSCHSLDALAAAAENPWVESVNTRINPYGMSMDGPPEKVVPLLKKIHAAGQGVVGMKIVGEGRLRNEPEKRQESLRFVLGLGCVDVLDVGFEALEEIDDLAAGIRKVRRAEIKA